MSKHLIAEWFFDEFEVILDELMMIVELRKVIIDENADEFEEEIRLQSYEEFIRSVSISCATKLGLSYEEVYDALDDKLEEMYYNFER